MCRDIYRRKDSRPLVDLPKVNAHAYDPAARWDLLLNALGPARPTKAKKGAAALSVPAGNHPKYGMR